MTIAIEQPPEQLSPEVAEWFNRQLIMISGVLSEFELQVNDLKERVETLENP